MYTKVVLITIMAASHSLTHANAGHKLRMSTRINLKILLVTF